MDHQDWKPVTLLKPITKKTTSITSVAPQIKYDEDGQEIIKQKTMDNKQSFIQMRETLKLTRAQIAQMLSVKVTDINDIENGNNINTIIAGRYKTLLRSKVAKGEIN